MPGHVVIESFDSQILAGNPLGDPTRRRFPVYLPPGYDDHEDRCYPVVYVLQGFSGRALAVENVSLWGESLSERLDRLIEGGHCPPIIAVAPECATRLGGSQYLDSEATGRYADYLVTEVVGHVDTHYRTIAAPGGRAIVGKSSGGYGALVLGMRHPEVFSALASHAGDVGFEYCYLPDFPQAIRGLGDPPDVPGFIERFLAEPKKPSGDFATMNILAMASCYSPSLMSAWGFDLPFDLRTGRIFDDVWERWKQHDPLVLMERHVDALTGMRMVHIDCGLRDNYGLHLGARQLSEQLTRHGVDHVHEEFDDDHFGLSYRYDVSIPRLAKALG